MLARFSGGNKFYETDYTSFESLLTSEIMGICECKLYDHLLSHFPGMALFIRNALTGKNHCYFKTFKLNVHGKRMSGEMCTSLGNGFTNLMLAKFLCFKQGCEYYGVVEGDDSLFYTNADLTPSHFERLGFTIKMIRVERLFDASFCGLNLSQDLNALCDVRKKLLNFGWTHSVLKLSGSKVRKQLLKAKAMSLLYEMPRCPIVSVLAKRTLELCSGVTARFEGGWYDRQLERESVLYGSWALLEFDKGVSDVSRQDFERLYDIPITQQLVIEDYFKQWRGGSLECPALLALFDGPDWDDMRDYSNNYVCTFSMSGILSALDHVFSLSHV
jgi:hypothetical protein